MCFSFSKDFRPTCRDEIAVSDESVMNAYSTNYDSGIIINDYAIDVLCVRLLDGHKIAVEEK